MLIMCRLILDTSTLRIRRTHAPFSFCFNYCPICYMLFVVFAVYQHDQNVYVARGKSEALIYP